MPKCPKCNKEVDSLDLIVNENNLYSYKKDGSKIFIEQIEFDIQYFKCPVCHERLDINADEESADGFLLEEETG